MSINSHIIKNEDGTSLVEVVASIVLLAVLLPSAAYLFVFSQSVIRNNQVRSDAIQVAEDIKQNFEYRSQTQDWADLNRISLVNFHEETKEDEMLDLRKKHLILDNTGVEYSKSDEPLYGEYLIQEKDEKRGDFIRIVNYDYSFDLPESLDTLENQKYMGQYIKWNPLKKEYQETDHLVRVDVLSSNDERIEEALDLEIGVWDKKTGSKLYSTVYKWVVKF
ncbi:hypothetical protein [uncultured Vagococcus sp.]|uniref:type IV pilus modification PilV family protein n=1 Tax=uncultured Vagococcus sp. TaxID=189676 RepID=UPI00258D066D|nr:hypothetical protein [uncultured Vagococcus sp.]